jgi:hypothetical protein
VQDEERKKNKEKEGDGGEEEEGALCGVVPTVLDLMVRPSRSFGFCEDGC